jgi:hypothetical protein
MKKNKLHRTVIILQFTNYCHGLVSAQLITGLGYKVVLVHSAWPIISFELCKALFGIIVLLEKIIFLA